MHFGIDYGAKLAGTTVICFDKDGQLFLQQSEKKKDADAFVRKWIRQEIPTYIFIDAPLSLPAAYFGKGEDFFYREGDKTLKAMSPMFLGGLTARAMKLVHQFKQDAFIFQEIYPAYLVKTLFPEVNFYKKEKIRIPDFLALLQSHLPLPIANIPQNWHQIDAILAWLSGYRYSNHEALFFGNEQEGCICV